MPADRDARRDAINMAALSEALLLGEVLDPGALLDAYDPPTDDLSDVDDDEQDRRQADALIAAILAGC